MRRRRTAAGLAGLAVLLLPAAAGAQPGRDAVEAGNRLYAEGRFEEARAQYLEALRAAPDSPVAPFNDGNALYRSDEFPRAAEAFRRAAESGDPAVEARAWYNLGNALYRQQQLEPALEAYKQALRRDPADVDAKHNLEATLEQLRQPPRPQPGPSDQQQDDDGEDEEDGDDAPRPREPGEQDPDRQDQPSPAEQGQQERDRQDQQGQDQQDQQGQEQQGQDRQEQQGQDQQDPQAGEPERNAQGQPEPPPSGGAPSDPPPGALSREDAERLLQAINEDPDRIRPRRRTSAPARPPRRSW